ncbi:MAG: glycerol-3-phosphate 1-O-acyltransferase PlsY [Sedimentisphaerales bacterium]|nr:glycerol-3-phosphate 1-O-acyltransferase PlsY [Sedimentisphaerales bacterium]
MDGKLILWVYVAGPVGGYLLGSIPFGLLIGWAKGVDVRKGGSGNIGSTNVGRLLGKKWGYLCFFLDVAKGLIPVLIGGWWIKEIFCETGEVMPPAGQWAWLAIGGACILGHMFSVYLGFRGGKGVATSLGVVLGIWPYFTLTGVVVFLIWVGAWGLTRYVSLASIIAAVAFPMFFMLLVWKIPNWRMTNLWPLLVFAILIAVLVIVRHRGNISRLLAGTESRGKSGPKTNDKER